MTLRLYSAVRLARIRTNNYWLFSMSSSHLDIRSGRVGEADIIELDSAVKGVWNYALIGAGINWWFLHRVHM